MIILLSMRGEAVNCPVGDPAIAHLTVINVEWSPVERFAISGFGSAVAWHSVKRKDDFASISTETDDVARVFGSLAWQFVFGVLDLILFKGAPSLFGKELLVPETLATFVQQFARPVGAITSPFIHLRQKLQLRMHLAQVVAVVVDIGMKRLASAEYGSP